MAKRKPTDEPPPQAPPASRPSLRRWLWQAALLAGAVALLLGGLMWLGQYARDQIWDRERFQVAFADIDCQPPPGVDRGDFLDEVLYHARCPERFSILEDGLADKLKQYFTRHPWVAQVDKVELRPPHAVRVLVTYRQAVLAIIVPPEYAGTNFTGDKKLPVRGVDHDGVLLPKKAPIVAGLAVLDKAPPPSGPVGQRWGNALVEAAAQTAVLLAPHQKKLELTRMALTPEGLVLSKPCVKVLWGQPGGAGEVAMDIKLQRLLEAFAALKQQSQPEMVEIDLRPAQAAQVRVKGLE
jgi:hypothetical protein